MRASTLFIASFAPFLVLACGGSSAPDIGDGDGGNSTSNGNQKSSSSNSTTNSGNKSSDGGSSSSGFSNGGSSGSGGSSGGSGASGSGSSDVKRVFVTSVTYSGNLGGASGADAKCQTAADAQVLGGSWKAWISSGSTNAIDRIDDVGPWYLVDGTTKVFNNKANLLTTPANAISETETGSSPSWMGYDELWTGSDQSGDASGNDCVGWTSDFSTDYGSTGAITTSQSWGGSTSGPLDCDAPEALICFEQ